ncbi:MAG: hypothetical protein ABI947_09110 [Chloroflexota bacterium]
MAYNKQYSQQDARRDMNMALDSQLSDTTQESLYAHLAESRQASQLWENMQKVDRLLANEPMLQAPPTFAAMLMASLSTRPAPQPVYHRTDLRAVVGLLLAVCVVLPGVIATLIVVQRWLSDPDALNMLVQRLVWLLNTIAQAFTAMLEVIAHYAVANPFLFSVAPMLMVAAILWSTSYVTNRREQIVYRIPVQAA